MKLRLFSDQIHYIMYIGICLIYSPFSVQWRQEAPNSMYQYFIKVIWLD
uniref:Uncharacterized protein n=1 Tax=Rhizophora mucronata TaxID=61149 RepID=A0A2P2M8E8_RHIMU